MWSCASLFVLLVCSGSVLGTSRTNGVKNLTASDFPPGFIFGAGSSAYQSEGAWNEGGKGENIWDRIIHTDPSYVEDKSNADIACDSYHRYKEDIGLLKNTGFSMYRLSISWSRVLPNGTNDYINEEGLEYYRNVFNELAGHNIEPMVTLYHWDLPQPLQDIGGWLNETMIYHFKNYAQLIFKTFGHQVKWWATFNEPALFVEGYSNSDFPPYVALPDVGHYIAAHNILRAHAKVYRMYEKEFKPIQKGKVSIALFVVCFLPKTDTEEDLRAAEQAMQFNVGWFAHPIYSSTGDYPLIMRNIIDRNSRIEGRNQSRLPYFTPEEIEEIKGSSDYFSLNHYTSYLVRFGTDPSFDEEQAFPKDSNIITSSDPKWPATNSPWFKVHIEGFRIALKSVRDQYGDNFPFFITENGYSDDGRINDFQRVQFYDGYLKEVLKAIVEDGVKLIGYITWSLIDVFEWLDGYNVKFGIYHVNFSDPQLPRRKKLSVDYWKRFLHQ